MDTTEEPILCLCGKKREKNKMNKYTIIKISFLVIAVVLIACGRGYWSQCRLAENVKKDVAMGRYNRALESLEGVRGSML